MKYLSLALGIALGVGAVVFLVVYHVAELQSATLTAIAPLAGFYHIAEMLERREARHSLRPDRQTVIHTFDGFCISRPVMVIYSTLVLVGAVELASLFGGIVLGAVFPNNDAGPEQVFAILLGFTFLAHIIGGYKVGRWTGERCRKHGIIAVPAAAALASIIIVGLDKAIMGEAFNEFMAIEGTAADLVILILGKAALFSVFGLVGYWRGRRRRLGKYMLYLISILPSDTRDVLVNLAFEEAKRAGQSGSPAPSRQAEPARRAGPPDTAQAGFA